MTRLETPATTGRVTLRDVAHEAGVSTASASYVLSGRTAGRAGVGRETAARIRAVADRLEYHPNPAARGIRTGRTGTVLLSLHMLSDPWALAVVGAVNALAAERELTTMILADGDWYSALKRQPADVAYIDDGGGPDRAGRLAALHAAGQRLVVFDEGLEADGFDVVRSRALPGCRLLAEHLARRHRSIGCLTTRAAFASDEPSRFSVFVGELASRGLALRPQHVGFFGSTTSSAYAAATAILSRDDRPTALYATTDFAAIAAIHAAHRLGLDVPGDVAIVGVGNTDEGADTEPGLTTAGPAEFYRRQAEIIVDRATAPDDEDGRLHEFPWSLVVRGSSTA